MSKADNPFRYFNSSPEIIRQETVRHWWNRYGPMFAADVRRQRVSRMKVFRQ